MKFKVPTQLAELILKSILKLNPLKIKGLNKIYIYIIYYSIKLNIYTFFVFSLKL